MMEKIDPMRNWPRVAPTTRVKKIKRQKKDTHSHPHQQQPEDDTQENNAEISDSAADSSSPEKKRRHRKQDSHIDQERNAPEDAGGDAMTDAPTGRRIDIRI